MAASESQLPDTPKPDENFEADAQPPDIENYTLPDMPDPFVHPSEEDLLVASLQEDPTSVLVPGPEPVTLADEGIPTPDNNSIDKNHSSVVDSTTTATTHDDRIVVEGDNVIQDFTTAKIVDTPSTSPEDVNLPNTPDGDDKEVYEAIQLTDDTEMDTGTARGAPIQPDHCDTSAPDGAASHTDEPDIDIQAALALQHPGIPPNPHTEVHSVLDPNAQSVPSTYIDATNDTHVATASNKRDQSPISPAPRIPQDLANTIKGMYRILDLVSEPGSGGLVDKIIIAQESFGRFANDICPGSYQSMTHVKFISLDAFSVKPLGLYGSKSELVRFMRDLGVVEDNIALLLIENKEDAAVVAQPILRSGLYFLRDPSDESVVYVLYWPEETTWDDNATSAIHRNRVTFMRYLTKITDQVVALISDEHANAIVWTEENTGLSPEMDEDENDRLFTFEVAKTKEQEESVSARPGFMLKHSIIAMPDISEHDSLPAEEYRPRLVHGETATGILTSSYCPVQDQTVPLREYMTTIRLRTFLRDASYQLDSHLSEDALAILFQHGLADRAGEQTKTMNLKREAEKKKLDAEFHDQQKQIDADKESQQSVLRSALCVEMVRILTNRFRLLDSAQLLNDVAETVDGDDTKLLATLALMYPEVKNIQEQLQNDTKLKTVSAKQFRECKERLLILERQFESRPDMDERIQGEMIAASNSEKKPNAQQSDGSILTRIGVSVTSAVARFIPQATFPLLDNSPLMDDETFLNHVPSMLDKYPLLADIAQETVSHAFSRFSTIIKKEADRLAKHIESIQRRECMKHLRMTSEREWNTICDTSRADFLQAVCDTFITDPHRFNVIKMVEKQQTSMSYRNEDKYIVIGIRQTQSAPSIQHTVRVLQLTEGDKHNSQLDRDFLPIPRIYDHSLASFQFNLPSDHQILHIQLLGELRVLLVTTSPTGIAVFVEETRDIYAAVQDGRFRKLINKERLGSGDVLLSYDELQRMLVICTADKMEMHIFIVDEHYKSLTGYGNTAKFKVWYDMSSDANFKLQSVVLRGGGHEELALLDNTGRIRLYSFTTQQCRPGQVQLHNNPIGLASSPDGACLFVIESGADGVHLQAYHWSSFGSTQGISLELTGITCDSSVLTSLVNRSACHFIGLDISQHTLQSTILDITHKTTEFTFKAERQGLGKREDLSASVHNCLIDCYRDVWTRFPVVPAVQRRTCQLADRKAPTLTFVSLMDPNLFSRYFHTLVGSLKSATRKPVDGVLDAIDICGFSYHDFLQQLRQPISQFSAGDWLVNTICLIPIHLAVARDNRFVPLKDGVWSADQEHALLGASVDQVIENLSFGWYESLFQSYMSSKPVRVVSSMGEQSVGKSFALNHLVDTSFAGSAMRTTEGVWMSVTPTSEALIVALDFEGVHSIERSAQEDSLLVLFNTALSNLVLFRNNFALSRDIAGLFQSFQSSSTILDPAANPSLFKSTLVIIIKDVVDSDKKEITKEFSLKFQKIVEVEQESNFISRLHDGKLAIIPWPVIESQQFYGLFPTLKRMLDKQAITHPSGGIFLQTVKTLMAKLKTNDWGSLDQNLASHRMQQLLNMLPSALQYGAVEVEPDVDPLRDLDNGLPIDLPDTDARFYIPLSSNDADEQNLQDRYLTDLQCRWNKFSTRQQEPESAWIEALSEYLSQAADLRLAHVEAWITANVTRFMADTMVFDTIRRSFETLALSLRASIHLCSMQCGDCQLLCLLGRHHGGPHSCRTDHQCAHDCQFTEEHSGLSENCGLPAGHPGMHICDISAHLCGRPCRLAGRAGCLERCAKIVNHTEEEHICPASSHACGMPCRLIGIHLPNNSGVYRCQETCYISSETPHTEHVCKKQSCPLPCQLCKRLCASPDHLHALDPHAMHLCGQEHLCSALCQSPGICRIETTPQSVEATFTGRHESFQYTKYTQASRRLACVITIPPGQLEHTGKHSHGQDTNAFHYCESRCENCGYFCTLPLGHTQQEHETSHGSMSRTRWAVDGPEGTIFEVNGRKFGSGDDGAPMLCSMWCRNLGRHPHIDYCRSTNAQPCSGADLQHLHVRMDPNPDDPKDWVTHDLYWRRTGFKDPYSQEDRTEFSKCDVMCGGTEHQADANGSAMPSYCTLPIFHAPLPVTHAPPGGVGYISSDGHHFSCRNPAQLQQAFHVIFVIDRSGSMRRYDERPLSDTPVAARIARSHNNRLGAVYSSLYAFWHARHATLTGTHNRRDSYSAILFNETVVQSVNNDFTSPPEELLNQLLRYSATGGTNYGGALQAAQRCMEANWSTERSPVIIFLSDGECTVQDSTVRDLCHRARALGRSLSFHTVSFGPSNQTLRRMVQVVNDLDRNRPADPMRPVVPSSYAEALDSVRLAETFLGLAESLKKPRGALMKA